MITLPDDLFQNVLSPEKRNLTPLFLELTKHHAECCPAYKKIIDLAFPHYKEAKTLAEIPYLPVSLFKYRKLRSIADNTVSLSIQSSGTTTEQKSQVSLDKETARLTSRSLSVILREIISNKRLPLLYIDAHSTLKAKGKIGARAAALLGLMPFGFDHCFALNDDLSLNIDTIKTFLKKYKNQDILIYGFTSLLWEKLKPFSEKNNIDLSNAKILHSGGWKHLTNQNISHQDFNTAFYSLTKAKEIINFYGMAEMPGVIYPENRKGTLTIPNFSAALIRDPHRFDKQPDGKEGLVQIFNPFAQSFPGHALLTEDIGVIENGALRILGRAPKAELRGCSDVIAGE